MASPQAVQAVLALFDAIWPREKSDKTVEARTLAYELALRSLDDSELMAAAKIVTATERFFPVPAVLIEAVRPKAKALVQYESEAHRAYAAILIAYEDGHAVGPREIEHRFGPEAAHAFCCAGGTAAFSWCEPGRDQAFRLKNFVEGYVESSEVAESERRAIGAGARKEIGRVEARRLLYGDDDDTEETS